MAVVNFDMSQFREFFQRMNKAAKGDLREDAYSFQSIEEGIFAI